MSTNEFDSFTTWTLTLTYKGREIDLFKLTKNYKRSVPNHQPVNQKAKSDNPDSFRGLSSIDFE